MKIKYFLLVLSFPVIIYSDPGTKIEELSKKYLGQPYVWGGTSPNTGMDCSGYTRYIFDKTGIKIPRTALAQSKTGKKVKRGEIKKGDLLFFLTDKSRNIPITHVGIYLGNDRFIHAASEKEGIIISSLNKSKYDKKYIIAKRYTQEKKIPINSYASLDKRLSTSSISTMGVKIKSFGGISTKF